MIKGVHTMKTACIPARLTVALSLVPLLMTGPLTLLSRPAMAAPTQDADKTRYTIKRLFTKGDEERYKISTSQMVPTEVGTTVHLDLNMTLKTTVRDLNADGGGVVLNELEDVSLKIGGTADPDLPAMLPKVVLTLDNRARIVKQELQGAAGMEYDFTSTILLFSALQSAFLPAKPAMVGDSWDWDSSFETPSSMGKPAKLSGKSTVLGKETIQSIRTLKVKSEVEAKMPMPDAATKKPTKWTCVGNVDIKTGRLIKMTLSQREGEPFQMQWEWKPKGPPR